MAMESVLNRLRDTVSATVYQVTSNLSTALPGNVLTREYELTKQIGSAGPGLMFKIYDAIKKSTKENASLFILEKKSLEKLNKKEKDIFLDCVRAGVSQLTRLRHPSMLTVQHSLEESRDLIAFATEPVLGSLANFFANSETGSKENSEFYDVEIKYGLLQISEGLCFLHNDAKLAHRNICPENVLINRNSIWKLSGFEWSVPTQNPNEPPYKFPSLKVIYDLPLDVQPNYTYTAPECLSGTSSTIENSADIFSFGMLAHTLYNKGKPLLPFTTSFLHNTDKYFSQLKLLLLSDTTYSCVPEDFRKHLKLLLSFDVQLRPDAQQISKLQIFQDVLARTLQYFDSIFQWDNAQKAQFYKNLPEILPKMPKRVKLRRIVTGLAKDFVNPDMVPFVLPNMILIAKETTDEEFHTWIVPDLVPVFKYKEPIQIGIFLLQNMTFLVEKFKSKPDSLREHIVPLIYRFLESDAYQIQELCLSVIPTVIHLVDYTGAKNMLLPRIKKLTLGTKLLSVRVNCLICLGKILENLDKWLVIDEVLPLVMQVPSREPAVLMASVGILKLALNSNKIGISKEMCASMLIPFLVPLSIENGLTLQQYATITAFIHEILNKIEEEHQAKLRQLDSLKEQQNSFISDSGSDILGNASNKPTTTFVANFDVFDLKNETQTPSDGVANKTAQLSLEDKERLAFQREQTERMKTQSMLVPQVNNSMSTTTKISTEPKNLTNTLINSNLNMFGSALGTTPRPSVNMGPTATPLQQQQFGVFSQTTRPQSSSNLSSLDNITIPNLTRKPQQTLNSMKPSTSYNASLSQPSMINFGMSPSNSLTFGNNNKSTNNSTKQLSQTELEEFLN